ncbi:MAG TPA: metallophosphoesterase [Candidatus Hydrogenedentes bacterium]|nr:metallophosphoesterase [Candidatus Hydrogenedentota bacterium]HRT65548.1 metallophosphoesterase [Candidatus Hydrogenedentota bacterium]
MILLLAMVAAAPGFADQDTFRFVVTGDSRGGDNGINSVRLSELVVAILAEQPLPDLVIFTGDLVNNGYVSQLEYWVQVFMEPLEQHGVKVYPIRGNHDAQIDSWRQVFSGVHALPNNGPPDELGMTYSFVHKNAFFIGMDLSGLFEINQEWLDEQLSTKNVPHLFVFNHYPAFSVDHVDSLAFNKPKRDAFWNSIGRAGGRVYFTGHDHFYNHSMAYDKHYIWIHQIVVGSAGAPFYDWNGVYLEAPRVQGIAHNRNNGYVVVDVDGYDVRSVFKERIELQPGQVQYVEFNDVFTYTAWGPGEGLPLSIATALLAGLLIMCLMLRRIAFG